jgi:hypothetical protein
MVKDGWSLPYTISKVFGFYDTTFQASLLKLDPDINEAHLNKKNEKLLYRRLFWADVLEKKLLNLENSIRRKKGKPEKSLVKGYNNKDKDH